MCAENIILQVKDGIAEIILNRPEKRNAISNKMGEEFLDALRQCAQDKIIKIIMIRGEGNSFCAGRDLGELAGIQENALQLYAGDSIFDQIYSVMKSIRKPIITAAHGYTMGGGLGLLAVSHYAIAAEDTVFALPEINFGLYPLGVITALWQTIGPRKSMQLGLLGERFTAAEAHWMGLVDYTVPRSELFGKTMELAKRLCQKRGTALLAGVDAYNALTEEYFQRYCQYFKLMMIPFMTDNEGKTKS